MRRQARGLSAEQAPDLGDKNIVAISTEMEAVGFP
jgi:hypothetical protein